MNSLAKFYRCVLLTTSLSSELLFSLSFLNKCLSIFGEGRESSRTWTQSSMEIGMAYLLDREKRFGRQGRFISQSEGFYSRIHTTYCAMLGLLCFHPIERKIQMNKEKIALINILKEPHPSGPVLLPNGEFLFHPYRQYMIPSMSEPMRPRVSLDLLLRKSTLTHNALEINERRPLEMYLKRDRKVLLPKPISVIREFQKQITDSIGTSSVLGDLIFKEACQPKGKAEKEWSQLRVGVVGNEWYGNESTQT